MSWLSRRQAVGLYFWVGFCLLVAVYAVVRSHGWHHALFDAFPNWQYGFVDQNAFLVERDAYYRALPPQDLQTKPVVDQAALLKSYDENPEAFVEKYRGLDRVFLFDAVVEAKNPIRIGRFGDGGKWLNDPESIKPGTVVYGFGCGDDISFDADMAGLFGCEVHCFDPAPFVQRSFASCPPRQPVGKGTVSYHPIGLGPISSGPGDPGELIIDGKKCQAKLLSELAAELHHTRVDILKIDIEGGEMAALTEVATSGTLEKLEIQQLLVEFHLFDDGLWSSFVHVMSLLRQHGYLPFRKEFNPLNPKCFEMAFVGPKDGTPANHPERTQTVRPGNK